MWRAAAQALLVGGSEEEAPAGCEALAPDHRLARGQRLAPACPCYLYPDWVLGHLPPAGRRLLRAHSDSVSRGDERSANSRCFSGVGSLGFGHQRELAHCRLHSWLLVGKLRHREAVLFSGCDSVSHLESG